jgi:hypothetical protein
MAFRIGVGVCIYRVQHDVSLFLGFYPRGCFRVCYDCVYCFEHFVNVGLVTTLPCMRAFFESSNIITLYLNLCSSPITFTFVDSFQHYHSFSSYLF